MKGYRNYMDRQQVSPALHDKLLALEQQQKVPRTSQPIAHWKPVLAMAACLCLVLGIGLFQANRGARDQVSADTAEFSMDANTAAAQSSSANDCAAPEDPLLEDGKMADDSMLETAAPESAEAAEDSADAGAAAERPDTSSDQTPPEDALLPAWLPEGYLLCSAEPLEQAHCYRLTWSDGTDEITLEYAYASQPPENLDWPVYDCAAADWDTVSQAETQDGVWGFCLYDQELPGWQCFTTTGDHETLWDVAQSMAR